MYALTFAFAIGYAFMNMLKKSEAQQQETGVAMLGSEKLGQFVKSFFLALLVLWTLETVLYAFILFNLPTY